MSSSPKRQKGVLKKVITKRKNLDTQPEQDEQRMTRFKTKAKMCTICYTSIESQVKFENDLFLLTSQGSNRLLSP